MFGISSSELVIILVVALILIGPQKLPDIMKAFGKGVAEFRRMTSDVRSTIVREIERADEAKRIEETKRELFGDDAPEAAKAEAPSAETVQVATSEAAPEAQKVQEAAAASAVQAQDAPSAGAQARSADTVEAAPAHFGTEKTHA